MVSLGGGWSTARGEVQRAFGGEREAGQGPTAEQEAPLGYPVEDRAGAALLRTHLRHLFWMNYDELYI